MKTALFALALMAAPLTVASVAHADACDDRARQFLHVLAPVRERCAPDAIPAGKVISQ